MSDCGADGSDGYGGADANGDDDGSDTSGGDDDEGEDEDGINDRGVNSHHDNGDTNNGQIMMASEGKRSFFLLFLKLWSEVEQEAAQSTRRKANLLFDHF